MTLSEHVVIWGGGRWASNYLSAITRINKQNCQIHAITSNKLFGSNLSTKIVIHSDESNLPVSGKIYSLILNNNINHQHAVSHAVNNNHNILCEKPLLLSQELLSEIYLKENIVFWESMLPCYCDYFTRIKELSEYCDNLTLRWDDSYNTEPQKKHDTNIYYNIDIIPHACSIFKLLSSNENKVPEIIERYSNLHNGEFLVVGSHFSIKCFCNRNATKRVRLLEGYRNNEKLFSFDFTEEPGYISDMLIRKMEIIAPNQLYDFQKREDKQKVGAIERQLYDFLFFDKKVYWKDRKLFSVHQQNFSSTKNPK